MKNKHSYSLVFYMLILLLFISGCSSNQPPEPEKVELKIAAASDLISAFTEIGKIFEEETDAELTFSFGSTGQLTDQIVNGAPFDIFAAANISFIEYLNEKNMLIEGTQASYAFGRVGIATLPDSPYQLQSLEDLLNSDIKKIAIANPEHAPYGLAAKQALESAGIWKQVSEKLVYGRNISDTLSFIETGNVEAGIIALSLYKEEETNFTIIDDGLHEPLEQSVAVIKGTEQEQLAREFIDFIKGPVGKPIMESYGFLVPEGSNDGGN